MELGAPANDVNNREAKIHVDHNTGNKQSYDTSWNIYDSQGGHAVRIWQKTIHSQVC
jgi:hypothetical protein